MVLQREGLLFVSSCAFLGFPLFGSSACPRGKGDIRACYPHCCGPVASVWLRYSPQNLPLIAFYSILPIQFLKLVVPSGWRAAWDQREGTGMEDRCPLSLQASGGSSTACRHIWLRKSFGIFREGSPGVGSRQLFRFFWGLAQLMLWCVWARAALCHWLVTQTLQPDLNWLRL